MPRIALASLRQRAGCRSPAPQRPSPRNDTPLLRHHYDHDRNYDQCDCDCDCDCDYGYNSARTAQHMRLSQCDDNNSKGNHNDDTNNNINNNKTNNNATVPIGAQSLRICYI